VRRPPVIWLTTIVTLLLFVYLLAALIRPEKF
jgi:K+-transporting ATPase KdpF subunit